MKQVHCSFSKNSCVRKFDRLCKLLFIFADYELRIMYITSDSIVIKMNRVISKKILNISFIMMLLLASHPLMAQQRTDYTILANTILNDTSDEEKFKLNELLVQKIWDELSKSEDKIFPLDSTALIYELISKKKDLQIISWGVSLNGEFEYFGFIKSYNQLKKKFVVWQLFAEKYQICESTNASCDVNTWPGGVYLKLIETEYKKRNYYTLLGWLAPENQTAHKIIEVLNIGKSGRPVFGKSAYFDINKKYKNRILFSYSEQSSFQLDYGRYSYFIKKWNKKKHKREDEVITDNLIVFDHLIPLYPDLKDNTAFLVPSGNSVDAFAFEKGKWRMKKDVDARNAKQKGKKPQTPAPQLHLFEEDVH